MINSEKIKPIYSEEVIKILEEVKIEELLRECHNLRKKSRLKEITNLSLIISSLKMYKRQKERVLRNRLKKGLRK